MLNNDGNAIENEEIIRKWNFETKRIDNISSKSIEKVLDNDS